MKLHQISDDEGLRVNLLDYGARITQINAYGLDLVCSYKDLNQFADDPFYLGATIGPITNRIKGGKLAVNGKHFQMPTNEGNNTLHSGGAGFDKEFWQVTAHSESSITFELNYENRSRVIPLTKGFCASSTKVPAIKIPI